MYSTCDEHAHLITLASVWSRKLLALFVYLLLKYVYLFIFNYILPLIFVPPLPLLATFVIIIIVMHAN